MMLLENSKGGRVSASGNSADLLKSLGWQEVKPVTPATQGDEKPKAATRKRNTSTRRNTTKKDGE